MLSKSTKLRGNLMAAGTGDVPVGPSMKPEEKKCSASAVPMSMAGTTCPGQGGWN